MKKIFYLISITGLMISCNKLDILEKKPSSDLSVPVTLDELMGLLQDMYNMNRTPALGEISADNFCLTSSFWKTLSPTHRNAYLWNPNIYESDRQIEDWKTLYRQILNANVVMEALPGIKITDSNKNEFRQVKGAALFFKAHAIYQVAQVFAPCYDSATALVDMGVPLRLSSSISEPSERASVAETYILILNHLKEAASLLDTIDHSKLNFPSRAAALALTARTYLSVGSFDSALSYANRALEEYGAIQDYNQLNLKSATPFKGKNVEIIFQTELLTNANCLIGVIVPGTVVVPSLYDQYDGNDLRKQAFFQISSSGLPNLKAGYSGSVYMFSGIATDEIHLIKSECLARLGKKVDAMQVLNHLLQFRWKAGAFIPLTAADSDEALSIILRERRKELPFRGLRWTDLRRLDKENLIPTLTRELDGKQYVLPPGDKRYVLPIPYDIISQTGMPQNPR